MNGAAWPARWRRDPLRLVAVMLVVVAGVSAAWFGLSWYRAAHDDGLAYSRTRDEVLRAAEQGIQNLNTLDYRTAADGLRIWQDSTTGNLHDQLVDGAEEFLDQIAIAQTITTATILECVITELDDRAGKASFIAAVEIIVTPVNGPPTPKRERLAGELTRTDAGWKLSSIGQVPVT